MNEHQEIIDYLASAPEVPADLLRAIQQWLADHGGEAATTGALRALWDRFPAEANPTAAEASTAAAIANADEATAKGLQRLLHAIDLGGRASLSGPAQQQAQPQPQAPAPAGPTPAQPGASPALPARSRRLRWLMVAASACVALSVASFLLGQRMPARADAAAALPPSTATTLLAAEGTVGSFTLPDGTRLWLNGGSSLTYANDLADAPERRVAISGEAYFEVTRNPDRPFIVEMETMALRVLGTSFTARSCGYLAADEVVLLSGEVEVESPLLPEKITMRPDQRVAVDRSSHDALVEPADAQAYCRWIQPVTTFDNEPLSDILIHLSRRYGLEATVAPAARANARLSITLSASQPLDEVIDIIEHILPVKMTVEGRTLTVAAAPAPSPAPSAAPSAISAPTTTNNL